MKNKKIISLILVLVLVLCTTISAFAGTSTSTSIGSYTWSGNLYPSNPIYSNPYAYAKSNSSVPIYFIKAEVFVYNTDGSANYKTATANSANEVTTGNQYANTFTSSGVSFGGVHEFRDSDIGSWTGYTYYMYY